MRVLQAVAVVLSATLVTFMATAETVQYKCAFRQITNSTYIAQTSVVTMDMDNWTAKVDDSIVRNAIGSNARADIIAQNDKRITLKWAVENLPFDTRVYHYYQTHKYYFSMSIFSDGQAKIKAEGLVQSGDQYSYAAIGTCKKV